MWVDQELGGQELGGQASRCYAMSHVLIARRITRFIQPDIEQIIGKTHQRVEGRAVVPCQRDGGVDQGHGSGNKSLPSQKHRLGLRHSLWGAVKARS